MNLVVDKPLIGWKDLDDKRLRDVYEKIIRVGDPELQEDSDAKIGKYCKENGCDFITPDKEAYAEFFEKGTEIIEIRRFGFNMESRQVVYLVRIR